MAKTVSKPASTAKTVPAPDKDRADEAALALAVTGDSPEQTDASPVQEAAAGRDSRDQVTDATPAEDAAPAQETGPSDPVEDAAPADETRVELAPSGKRAEKDVSYVRPERPLVKS